MILAKMVIVSATPRMFPTFLQSDRIPLPTPISVLGMLDRIAVLDGDWNKPFAIPMNPETKTIACIGVFSSKVINSANARMYVAAPNKVMFLLPCFPA